MIERTKVSFTAERQTLTWCIAETKILKEVHGVAAPEFFESYFARIIAGWVWDFYDYTKEAPGKLIIDLYRKRKDQIRDSDELELVSDFLASLSESYMEQKINIDYSIKEAIKFFKERSLKIMVERVTSYLSKGDVTGAENQLHNYKRVDRQHGKAVDITRDVVPVVSAFADDNNFMFNLPGVMAETFAPINRGDFVGILAPPNRGKTWWIRYLGMLAAQNNFNVFSINLEQQEAEAIRRDFHIFVNQPKEKTTVEIPVFKREMKEDEWEVSSTMKFYDGFQQDIRGNQDRAGMYQREGSFLSLTLPAFTTTWTDILNHITNIEEYDGIPIDAVCIDYMDLIGSVGGTKEYRHQLNEVYTRARGYCVESNKLIITGSQSNKKGINGDIDESDMAEDMRKLAHLTHLMVLNQSKEEYGKNIMRVWNGKRREGKRIMREICVLSCYDIGRPYIDSRWADEVMDYKTAKGEEA